MHRSSDNSEWLFPNYGIGCVPMADSPNCYVYHGMIWPSVEWRIAYMKRTGKCFVLWPLMLCSRTNFKPMEIGG